MNIAHAEFVMSNTRVEQCPKSKLPEYAFIGRSNVGKSSLINMLCNRKKLAKTSSRPGKTSRTELIHSVNQIELANGQLQNSTISLNRSRSLNSSLMKASG